MDRQHPAEAVDIHLAMGGSDDAEGTPDRPLASPAGARDLVRRRRRSGLAAGVPVTIWLHGGTYRLTEPLALAAEDGGTEEAPVTWRAEHAFELEPRAVRQIPVEIDVVAQPDLRIAVGARVGG